MSKEIEKLLNEIEYGKNNSREIGIEKQAQMIKQADEFTMLYEGLKYGADVINIAKNNPQAQRIFINPVTKEFLKNSFRLLKGVPKASGSMMIEIIKLIARGGMNTVAHLTRFMTNPYVLGAAVAALIGWGIGTLINMGFEKIGFDKYLDDKMWSWFGEGDQQQNFYQSKIYKSIIDLFKSNNEMNKFNTQVSTNLYKKISAFTPPINMTSPSNEELNRVLTYTAKIMGLAGGDPKKALTNYKQLIQKRTQKPGTPVAGQPAAPAGQPTTPDQQAIYKHIQYFNNTLNKFNRDTGSNLQPITFNTPEIANLKNIEDFKKLPQVQEVIKKQNELNNLMQPKSAKRILNFTKIAQTMNMLKPDGLWGPQSQQAWQQLKAPKAAPAAAPAAAPKVPPAGQPTNISTQTKVPSSQEDVDLVTPLSPQAVTSTDVPKEYSVQMRQALLTVANTGNLSSYYKVLVSQKQPEVWIYTVQGMDASSEIRGLGLDKLFIAFNSQISKLSAEQKQASATMLENIMFFFNKINLKDAGMYVNKYLQKFEDII